MKENKLLKKPYVKVEKSEISGIPFDLPKTLPHPKYLESQIGIDHLNDEQLFDLFSIKPVKQPKKTLRPWQRITGARAEMHDGNPVLVYATRILKVSEAKSQLFQRNNKLAKIGA
ncbi:hypothetical protein [Kiloniella majae]|uniref:hypothetical protein n=1 Tax=Kiloniella majae TaxID=1938558 RepID=UPI000A276E7C|nr:hypothetical protein [Kiloniella majae]